MEGKYLNSDGVVTTESGSSRKCFWDISPVVVLMVTTGKPICSTQVFMMLWSGLGRVVPVASTA